MRTLAELARPAKSAVIVVDVQNDFCRAEGALGKAGASTAAALEMIPNLQRLLTAARAAGTAVIFIQTIHESATDSAAWAWRLAGSVGGSCRKDTWGAEFTEVAPLTTCWLVTMSPFVSRTKPEPSPCCVCCPPGKPNGALVVLVTSMSTTPGVA